MIRLGAVVFVFLLIVSTGRAGSRLRGAKGPVLITQSDLVDRNGALAQSSTTLVVIGNTTIDEITKHAQDVYTVLSTLFASRSESQPAVAYYLLPTAAEGRPQVNDDIEDEGHVHWDDIVFPNVMLFYGKVLSRWYRQPRSASAGCTGEPREPEFVPKEVSSWIERRSIAAELDSAQEVELFSQQDGNAIIGFGLDRTTREAFSVILKLAPNRASSLLHFAKADASLVPEALGSKKDASVVLWNNQYLPPRHFEFSQWSTDNLAYTMLNWILENVDAPVMNARGCNEEKWNKGGLHSEDGKSMATERHTLMLYFPAFADAKSSPPVGAQALLALVPQLEKSKVQLAWVDYDDEVFAEDLLEQHMLGKSDLPALRMQVVPRTPHGLYGHKPSTLRHMCELQSASDLGDSVRRCLTAVDKGEVKAFFKSEPPVEQDGGPVKIIVGSNFDSTVLETPQDVMVLFCAPWCGFCKKFEPKFKELARKVKAQRPWVVFTKTDVTRNENRVYDFWKSPQLHLWPAKNKEEPLYYDMHGDSSVETLEKFVLVSTLESAPEGWQPEPSSDDQNPSDLDAVIGEL